MATTAIAQPQIGMLGREPCVGPDCPVIVPAEAAGMLRRVGIPDPERVMRGYPHELSGGMRQRCALVRTLMFQRDLILLDEPLSALDAITRQGLQDLLLMLQSEFNKTILMITHDIEEAVVLGEKILVLGNDTNREPVVIENNLTGRIDKRNDSEFLERCQQLRMTIGTKTVTQNSAVQQ